MYDGIRHTADKWRRAFDYALDQVSENADNNVVISAENLGEPARGLDQIETAKRYLDRWFDTYRVIVYFREPLAFLGSRIAQAVKTGYSLQAGKQSFAPGRYLDFVRLIRNYEKLLNPDRDDLCIRSYDKVKLEQGSIYTDFATHGLQLPADALAKFEQIKTEFANRNHSISHDLLIVLNEYYEWNPAASRANNRLAPLLSKVSWPGPKIFGDIGFQRAGTGSR